MQFDRLAGAGLLKLATILHENYRSFDLAAFALAAYDRQNTSSLQDRYLRKLAGIN